MPFTLFSKKKDYSKIAVIQIILILAILCLGDIFQLFNLPDLTEIQYSILLVAEAVYLIMLIQLAQFLRPSKNIRNFLILVLIVIFILSLIAINPFVKLTDDPARYLIVVHTLLCPLECYLIALGLKDIYSTQLHITKRLWGSVAVYLMIAIGWGSLYEVINLAQPNSFGVTLVPGYQSFSESLYYSLCSISGTGTVYTSPSHLVRNLALIEAVWGVLFLVMLIGRLFSLPSADREE